MTIGSTFKYVGGTIFYIDSTADGTYIFKNALGETVSAPSVGDDCTGWTYEVTGGNGVDKYYVCNSEAVFGANRTGAIDDPYICWTYFDEANSTYTGNMARGVMNEYEYFGYYGRVSENLNFLDDRVGYGKSNTAAMMAIERPVTIGGISTTVKAYVQGPQIVCRDSWEYAETVWYVCDQYNKRTYMESNTTGCDDWYIPSFYEVGRFILCFDEKPEILADCIYYYPYVFTSNVQAMDEVLCVEIPYGGGSTQPKHMANSILVLIRSF